MPEDEKKITDQFQKICLRAEIEPLPKTPWMIMGAGQAFEFIIEELFCQSAEKVCYRTSPMVQTFLLERKTGVLYPINIVHPRIIAQFAKFPNVKEFESVINLDEGSNLVYFLELRQRLRKNPETAFFLYPAPDVHPVEREGQEGLLFIAPIDKHRRTNPQIKWLWRLCDSPSPLRESIVTSDKVLA